MQKKILQALEEAKGPSLSSDAAKVKLADYAMPNDFRKTYTDWDVDVSHDAIPSSYSYKPTTKIGIFT